MYCIDCGTQNLDTTRYCKSCGADLETVRYALTQPLASGGTSLIGPRHVWFILVMSGLTGLGGLGIVFGVLMVLAGIVGPTLGGGIFPLLFLLGAIGTAGVCFIVFMMLRMLRTSSNGAPRPAPSGPLPPRMQAPEPPRQLNSTRFREGMPSVVEHTTSRLGEYAPPPRDERER